MDFFNFKEQNRNKKINKRIVLVMFAMMAIQITINSYKADITVAEVEVDDTQQIILMANNA